MAEYAILIYTPASADPAEITPEDRARLERGARAEADTGAMLAAFELQAASTATSIRGDALTDGPFIEAKEVIAGFCVIEAPDLDAALEIARGNPALALGAGIEVRPVFGGFVAGRSTG
ncbi:transcription initiation protein [Streptosporangiaceae bacterium NEAU-GS5]|nr:transcription initiation protein [Streptosporangiaceae bacterium NEAU-GS5]